MPESVETKFARFEEKLDRLISDMQLVNRKLELNYVTQDQLKLVTNELQSLKSDLGAIQTQNRVIITTIILSVIAAGLKLIFK